MSSLKFTKEQQQAIESKEKTLLVSASAGSGKTKVLVERIISFIKNDRCSLKNMLVVTFTNMAALEMKTRLKQLLEQNLQDEFFVKQLDELNVANISTFHKFCQNVVKEFFYHVQLDPNFSILDENQSNFYKEKAFLQLFDYYSKKEDQIFNDILEIFYEHRNLDDFKAAILKTNTFLLSKPKDYLDTNLNGIYSEDLSNNIAINYFVNYKNEFCNYYIKTLSNLKLQSEMLSSSQLVKLIDSHIENFKKILKADYFNLYSILKDITFDRNSISKATVEEDEIKEVLQNLIKQAKTNIDKLLPCTYDNKEDFLKNLVENKQFISKFYEIIEKFNDCYKKIKQKNNLLDFNDLEHYALKILENSNIRNQLQQRFTHLFIDEYQDTNEVQEQIISLLTKDNFVFMVGDVKQSIYLFRQCNPQIFINKFNVLTTNNSNSVIKLNKNFRSDQDILNFNNLVFDNLMTPKTSQIDYKQTSSFVFGENFTRVTGEFKPVNICVVNSKTKKQEEEIITSGVYSVKNDSIDNEQNDTLKQEVIVTADKIKTLLSTKIYDIDLQTERNITFSDIAILTTTKKSIQEISSVLESLNIPVNSKFDVELFETPQAMLLTSYLKILNNPDDDLSLAGVLKSPLFNINENDLLTLTSCSGESLYKKCVNYLQANNDNLSVKIDKLFNDLKLFNNLLIVNDIHSVLMQIISYYDFEKLFYNHENFVQVMQNFKNYLQVIKETQNNNLSALVNYLDTFSAKTTVPVSIKNSVNSVYVGTIHSSKGLEYPVVFLLDTAKPINQSSIIQKLLLSNDFGISLSSYNIKTKTITDSVIKNISKIKILEQQKQEYLRLLYVAITRPKCYLFVVGSTDVSSVEKIETDYEVTHTNNFLHLILGSLDNAIITQLKNGQKNILAHYENLSFNIQLFNQDELNEVVDDNTQIIPFDKNLTKQLQDYINIKFDSNDYVFKNTVTALNNVEDHENYNISNMKNSGYLDKNSDEDFLLIGTVYHLVMQHIQLKTSSLEEVKNQVQKMIEKGILSSDDYSLIDITKIHLAVNKLAQLIDSEDVVLREKPFMYYPNLNNVVNTEITNNILVQGVVDLIIIKQNEIYLVDYKTTRISNQQKLAEKYKTQFKLYQNALESFYKKPVTKKIICSFYLKELIFV